MVEAAPAVVGLDLSLTSSGVAEADGSLRRIKVKTKGAQRLANIRSEVMDIVFQTATVDEPVDLVVIEGYAFSRPNQAHFIGELGGVIRLALYDAGIDFVVVPPTKVKKYATGKGNAGKDDVLSAIVHRTGMEMNNDEADAWTLRAMGLDGLGHPIITMPESHRAAIKDVQWRP